MRSPCPRTSDRWRETPPIAPVTVRGSWCQLDDALPGGIIGAGLIGAMMNAGAVPFVEAFRLIFGVLERTDPHTKCSLYRWIVWLSDISSPLKRRVRVRRPSGKARRHISGNRL
jgi:hypothetical protein